MPRYRGKTTLKDVTAQRALVGLFGIAGTRGIEWILPLLVGLAMVADAVDRMLKRIMNVVIDRTTAAFWADGTRYVIYDLALIAVLAMVMLWLIARARRATDRLCLETESFVGPPPAEVLVLMLSPAKTYDGAEPLESIKNVTSTSDPALRNHNWFMPAIAVEHHKLRLRRVVVFTSRGISKKDAGSHEQFEQFSALLRRIANNVELKIHTPAEYLNSAKFKKLLEQGIDVENMPETVDAIDDTYHALIDTHRADRVAKNEIMFDITGTTKMGSSAILTVALGYDIPWQYCQSDGTNRKVTSYRTFFVTPEK